MGCDAPGQQKAAAASASTARPTQPATGWSIDDQPVAHQAALAIGTKGETALRITLSTAPLSCDSLASGFPGGAMLTGATLLDVWLMQPLQADGSLGHWSIAGAQVADSKGRRGLTAQGAQVGELTVAGQDVHIKRLELALLDGTTGKTIMWTGDLTASHCPRVARDEADRPQAKLILSVAGRQLPVNGATLHPNGQQHFLRLTQAPHDCASDVAEGYDFYLDLTIEGEPPALKLASLQGAIFPSFPSGSTGRDGFKVEADGPLDGPGEVTLKLAGSLDLRGYQTKLTGEVSALRCDHP